MSFADIAVLSILVVGACVYLGDHLNTLAGQIRRIADAIEKEKKP